MHYAVIVRLLWNVEKTSQPATVRFLPDRVQIDAEGTRWNPCIVGRERSTGLWEAWLEFRPEDGRPRRVTDRETTQPNHNALEYWAGGLEPVYFEGAFRRARQDSLARD
jgi:hypothetical protein